MAIKNRLKTEPIPVVRQSRPVKIRDVTTMLPGKLVPIAAFNLLRMDSCTGRLNVAFQMAETYEQLMNGVSARITAWFIPHVANERFERNTAFFERSFAGQPKTNAEGDDVIPFFDTHVHGAAGAHPIYKALGLHAKEGATVNAGYREGYNLVANHMRKLRSKSLPMRELDDASIGPAMWGNSAFSDIVPDFDDAMIAGELPLTVVSARMPITGLFGIGAGATVDASAGARPSDGPPATGASFNGWQGGSVAMKNALTGPNAGYPDVFASMSQDGITVSLANIDQARKLVDWAKLREQYEGHEDAWIIDAYMQGLEIDDQSWFQPMLLDTTVVEIKQAKRMASDGPSLEEGAANGAGVGSIGINVPPNTYGGIVMIFAEALPEQLYERQADPYFTTTTVAGLPNYMQDVLNPVPVVKVLNKEIDVDHDTPDGQFGWARRNWKWAQWPTRVGGDLFAPNADAATTVARRMIYPTDVENPSLSQEFYLSTTLGLTPFMDQTKDPIVVGMGGQITVTGLTVVGEVHESEANYDEMRQQVLPLQHPKE